MRAGGLRHRVAIERRTDTPTASGGTVPTWSVYRETRAQFDPLTGREYHASDQLRAETTHKITIRYVDGITESMRVRKVRDGRLFAITGVVNVQERSRMLVLLAREVR